MNLKEISEIGPTSLQKTKHPVPNAISLEVSLYLINGIVELYSRGYILDVLEVHFTCGCEQYDVHIIQYYVMVFSSVYS